MKTTAVLFFVSLIMNSTVLVAAVENSHASVGPSAHPSVREQKEIVQIAQSVAGVNSLFNQTEIKGKE